MFPRATQFLCTDRVAVYLRRRSTGHGGAGRTGGTDMIDRMMIVCALNGNTSGVKLDRRIIAFGTTCTRRAGHTLVVLYAFVCLAICDSARRVAGGDGIFLVTR